MACTVYVSVACVMVFPFRVAAPIAVALVVGTIALGAREDWGSQVGTAFGIMAASVAVFGLRAVMTRNIDLVNAQLENSRLAVDNERTRFARDLHDIMGHSLTVITVKAELAQKLLDVDVERARAEIADLERLSRDALTDVRRAVEGYRDITLPGELVRARVALRAAEIDAELPNSTDDVPSELRELFAWTVREGVTNVIRHSGARHCEVRLTATSAEVRDDGPATHVSQRPGLRAGRAARAGHRRRRDRRHPGALPRLLALRGPSVTIRLLLADDQALVRGALSALLTLESDLEVVAEVGTGDAVVPAVLEHHPDVALIDVEMPGLDGISATAEVRRASPDTKVLIVTTFGRPGYLRRALQAGAAGFVVKDTPAAQLADAVRRVHAGLRVVDPALATDSLVAGESPLTQRETEVLRAAQDGSAVAAIARKLFLSQGTVRNHLSSAIGKTGASNRAEAVIIADGNGWL